MASEATNDIENSGSNSNEEFCDAKYKNELCDKIFELFKSGDCVDLTLVAAVDQKR